MESKQARPEHNLAEDEFFLFDLKVVVENIGESCTCGLKVGDYFEIKSGKLFLPDGCFFCLYALQSTLPLLPAKQRPLQSADWMNTDVHATCPDPMCGLIMRIDRMDRRVLHHSETSVVPLKPSST